MWPVPSVPWKIVVPIVALLSAFAAGWYVQGQRSDAALSALRSEYTARVVEMQGQAKALQAQAIKQAQEADSDYQAKIADIQAAADARPARIVRVRCPAPVPAAGDYPARDPGQPDAAAADRSGVGPDAGPGAIDLDASGLVRIVDESKKVSARLRALQGVCR